MSSGFSPGDYDFDKERARSYLLLLTPTERKVLALRCDRKKYREIAENLVVTQKDVEYHLGNVYTKLKLDFEGLGYNERFFILVTFFCPMLREMIGEELKGGIIPWGSTEIIPSPKSLAIVRREVDDEEAGPIEVYKPPSIDIIPWERRGRNIWPYLLGALLVVSIGVIIYLLTRPSLPPVTILHTVMVTPPPVAVIDPSTEVALVVSTETPAPTNTPEPTPTETIVPTPTVSDIIFEDDFTDNELSSEWSKIEGDYFFTDNALRTSQSLELTIDPGTNNYEVSVGVVWAEGHITRANFVGVHINRESMIVATISSEGGGSYLWYNDGQRWYQLDKYGEVQNATFRVVVRGSQIGIYRDLDLLKSYTNPNFTSGLVKLKIRNLTRLSFFRIRELEP